MAEALRHGLLEHSNKSLREKWAETTPDSGSRLDKTEGNVVIKRVGQQNKDQLKTSKTKNENEK